MSTDSGAYIAPPSDWIPAIRCADIDLDRKGALLVFASYANYKDDPEQGKIAGEGIHPGIDRFAQDIRKSVATARRHLAWAREVGIVELARRANRRKGLSDEYRLILSMEALAIIGVPDPEQYKEMIGEGVRHRKATAKAARERRAADVDHPDPDDPDPSPQGDPDDDQRSPEMSANGTDYRSPKMSADTAPSGPDDSSDYRSSLVSANTAISAQMGPGLALTQDERPPKHVHTNHVDLTKHEVAELRTEPAVPRARAPLQDPISRGGIDRPAGAGAPGTASPAGSPPPPPTRRPCPTGIGVCIICAERGDFVIATNPATGSRCATHVREAAHA